MTAARLVKSVMLPLLFLAAAGAGSVANETRAASQDDAARILAGIPPAPTSPLAALTTDARWKQHARFFDIAWKQLDIRQLSKVRAWSRANLTDPQPTLYYMFSGPDFLYADAFFPDAYTYVMSGLEPVGAVPDLQSLPRGTLGQEITQLEASLNSVLSYSFFITNKMRVQLNTGKVTGTLPILYVFLARSGKTIDSVTYMDVDADGKPTDAETDAARASAKGVRIRFTDAAGLKRTLYYFSTDVSDSGLKSSGFLKFCATLGKGDGFLKSASYLMHSDNFSGVRDFVLSHTSAILQDDSGIPLRSFSTDWQIRPYGRYVGPIGLFAGKSQQRMYDIYRSARTEPLDFSLGYQWKARQSNLMLALKGASQQPAERSIGTDAVPSRQGNATDPPVAKPPRRRVQRRVATGTDWISWVSGGL